MGAADFFLLRFPKETFTALQAQLILQRQAQLCSAVKPAVTKETAMDIFYPRTLCKEQPSYLSGPLRRPANTKITVSMSLACTCHTHLPSSSFVISSYHKGTLFSAATATSLLQGQKENIRTRQTAFRIHYVMFSGTAQPWCYAEYLYKQACIRISGQHAELHFTHYTGCRQHAKPSTWTSQTTSG